MNAIELSRFQEKICFLQRFIEINFINEDYQRVISISLPKLMNNKYELILKVVKTNQINIY